MKNCTAKSTLWFNVLFLLILSSVAVSAQPNETVKKTSSKPLLQPIVVHKDPLPSSTPYIKKNSDTAAVNTDVVAGGSLTSSIRTTIPVLAEVAIPGYSGVLVETLDGKPVVASGDDIPYNPASNVKVATAFAVLKTFGPNFRFATNVWTDGSFDQASGTIIGNLYISGRDPVFGYEHAVTIANELNKRGIRSISGDLIVTDNFAMNYNQSSARSSQLLYATLDSLKRSAAATKAYQNHSIHAGKPLNGMTPSISFTGSAYVQPMPSSLKLIFTHESAPLKEIVKVTMCYSNNFLAERLGDMVGGPFAVSRLVHLNAGVDPAEFYLQTSSGLGINRVTPRAMMKLLRTFRAELGKNRMTFADVMPVAGMDQGTLVGRFATDFARGSVVGKTGTLGRTDQGVSTLAGEINTRGGRLLFVIFNQRGSVQRFRSFQNYYVSLLQGQFGGPAALNYNLQTPDVRLAKTRISTVSQ